MSEYFPPGKIIDERILIDLLADVKSNGRFGILLGAGCSLTSGVPIASGILQDTKNELYRIYNSRAAQGPGEIEEWLRKLNKLQDPRTAYGEALEWLRPNARLRRAYLEQYFLVKIRPRDTLPSRVWYAGACSPPSTPQISMT